MWYPYNVKHIKSGIAKHPSKNKKGEKYHENTILQAWFNLGRASDPLRRGGVSGNVHRSLGLGLGDYPGYGRIGRVRRLPRGSF